MWPRCSLHPLELCRGTSRPPWRCRVNRCPHWTAIRPSEWIISGAVSSPRAIRCEGFDRCARSSDPSTQLRHAPGERRGYRRRPNTWFKIATPFRAKFTRRLRAMGIRDRPIAPRSPWQNGHAERLIGSLRRECLDHVVVFNEKRSSHASVRICNPTWTGTESRQRLAKSKFSRRFTKLSLRCATEPRVRLQTDQPAAG
jgi:transposase InsO family protein